MMPRFGGTCEWLADVDATQMARWIEAIPFSDWHQNHRVDAQLRPAMMTDLSWHGFGDHAAFVVAQVPCGGGVIRQQMLSVVMPGHEIPTHIDDQDGNWCCRIHVPLLSNDDSRFVVGGIAHHLRVGSAYKVNTLVPHAVHNDGSTPRVHFMFDVTLR